MKTKLAVMLFLLAPALQSSTEFAIEHYLVSSETFLLNRSGWNRYYADMFQSDPVAQAFFLGKEDAYSELLVLSKSLHK